MSISSHAKIYGNLKVGKNVRIDDGCILTGDIEIGDYVHIGAYSVLLGKNGIKIGSFTGFSPFTVIFTSCDDFSGETLFGPTIPEEYKNIKHSPVTIGDFVICGVKSSIVAVDVPDGVSLGGHSMLKIKPHPWSIYAGSPARYLGHRDRGCVGLAEKLR